MKFTKTPTVFTKNGGWKPMAFLTSHGSSRILAWHPNSKEVYEKKHDASLGLVCIYIPRFAIKINRSCWYVYLLLMEIHHGYDGNDHPESWIKKNWWIWVFQNLMKFKHAHMDGRFHKRSRILDEIFQHAPPEVVIHLAPEKLYIFLKKVKDPLPSIHHFLKGFQNCWTSGDVKVHIQGANGVDQPYPWWCWCFFSVRIAW